MAGLTSTKARKILRDKSVRGKRLTGKQKRLFGFVAGGGKPSRLGKIARRMKK